MRVIAQSTLRAFWKSRSEYADAKGPLEAWYWEVKQEQWTEPSDVKAKYRTASILKSGRIVFNIAGNKYRLVVHVHYATGIVFVRFVGTHKQYDRIERTPYEHPTN